MKKLLVLVAAILTMAATATAGQVQVGYFADPVTSDSRYGEFQAGNGGEFTLTPVNESGWLDLSDYVSGLTADIVRAGSFQTFCIEGAENIYPYGATYDAAINTNAVWGGAGSAGDPLSVGTGWLYSQFASGTLDYAYTGTESQRETDALALQQAIWWLEGEESINYSGSNEFMLAVVTNFGSQTAAQADGAWEYGVYALNLTSGITRYQDQLYYYVPDGGTTVPDGGLTALLLGIGVGGFAVFTRKLRM
jgi:hypothetical protein